MFQKFESPQKLEHYLQFPLANPCAAGGFSGVLAAEVRSTKVERETVGLHDSVELAICWRERVSGRMGEIKRWFRSMTQVTEKEEKAVYRERVGGRTGEIKRWFGSMAQETEKEEKGVYQESE